MKNFVWKILVCSLVMVAGVDTYAQNAEVAMNNNKNILIAYYSYSGNTKTVAEAIQKEVGGDLFEIKTEGEYPGEYRQMTLQAQKEIRENYRPKLTTLVNNMAKYDIVFLGSPNWWGTITPQVSSFLQTYDLNGKKVFPFITHGGGGKQNTVADMKAQCVGCVFEETKAWSGYGDTVQGIGEWIKTLSID